MLLVSLLFVTFAATTAVVSGENCAPMRNANSKLFCYYSKLKDVDSCKCTHVVLPSNSDVKAVEKLRSKLSGVKILVTVHEFNEGLVDLLKKTKIDGLEVDLKKLDSKSDIGDFISTAKSKLGGDLYTTVSIPPRADLLAKFYDFKGLAKNVDNFVLQTAFLGASTNVTFHPSRLSGLWDMQNADSVVDLVSGLGAPLSKLVIAAPVQAFRFKLQDEKHTAPGSPALEIQSITREDLCRKMTASNWTLERDQDQAGPYIFRNNEWIAFDDPMSIDIKAKYTRVRGLAGLALKDLSQDGGSECGGLLLEAAYSGLSKQSRAPRGAVLQSLEREILTPARPLHNIQVSPYRITRIIDTEGKIHAVRQDTRTEFECSRQGYFVHPRSCNRFYRCVKFNQLTDEYNVFEFDCPAGLAFDGRVEVCVWPGSLSDGSACSGSSEIAPVPKERFVCPHEPGYYADHENCRWFFACLDHGQSTMTAYEFRCPFGLVFDETRLVCEWPWLVPKCASGYAGLQVDFYGGGYGTHGAALGVNGVVDAHGVLGAGGLSGGSNLIGLHGAGSPQGVILENYHGLGPLQSVALGGLHGPIDEPLSKVYSSFGNRGGVFGGDTGHGTIGLGVASGASDGHGLIGFGAQVGQGGHGLGGSYIQSGLGGNQHDAAGHLQQGAVLVGVDGGNLGHGANLAQGSVLLEDNRDIGQGHVIVDGGVGLGHGLSTVNLGQDGHGIVGVNVQNLGQDGTSHIGALNQHNQRGSGRYQTDLSHATQSGKSTTTYHRNLGASGGLNGYYGGSGTVEGVRLLSTIQPAHDDGNDGVLLSQNIGLDGSRLGHRGSVRYQTDDAALNSQSDGKSTITYHGNYGSGDQFAGKSGSISAGHDGVVLVQDGGVGLAGNEQFGQRGSSRFQAIGADLGGKSTVTYHGNHGQSNRNLFDQGEYSINSPADRASLVFGTKLRGSKIVDGNAVITGEKFASNYIQPVYPGDGLKLTNQVLVGHDLSEGANGGKSVQNTVTYHGNRGSNSGNIGLGGGEGGSLVNGDLGAVHIQGVEGVNVDGIGGYGGRVTENSVTYHGSRGSSIDSANIGLGGGASVVVNGNAGGHDLGSVHIQGVERVNVDGIGYGGKVGQNSITYHGNRGSNLDSANIGLEGGASVVVNGDGGSHDLNGIHIQGIEGVNVDGIGYGGKIGQNSITYHGNRDSNLELANIGLGGGESLVVNGDGGSHDLSGVHIQGIEGGSIDGTTHGGKIVQNSVTYHGNRGSNLHSTNIGLGVGASLVVNGDGGSHDLSGVHIQAIEGVNIDGISHGGKVIQDSVTYHGNRGSANIGLGEEGASLVVNGDVRNHDLGAVHIQGVEGVNVDGINHGGKVIQNSITYHGNGGSNLDSANIGLGDGASLVVNGDVRGHDLGAVQIQGIGGGNIDSGKVVQNSVTYHGNTGSNLGGGVSQFVHGDDGRYDSGAVHIQGLERVNINGIGNSNGLDHQVLYQSGLDQVGDSGLGVGHNRGSIRYHGGESDNPLSVNRANAGSSSYQNYNRHDTGRVNIVGGGFSAVGVYPNSYKQATPDIQTVTASPIPVSVTPISVTASHIPIVTSVPIPTTHTSDNLDVYNGNGVVANLPELQVKVESPGVAIVPDIRQGHTAATGAALEVVNGGYVYDKPGVSFVDGGGSGGAKSYVHQSIEHGRPTLSAEPISQGHPTGSYTYLGKSTAIETVTPSLQRIEVSTARPVSFSNLHQVGVTPTLAPIEHVTPAHYVTSIVDNATPSVLVKSHGEPIGQVDVSTTVRPVSYSTLNYGGIESVTPSVTVKPAVSYGSFHFGTADVQPHQPIVENVTPSILVQEQVPQIPQIPHGGSSYFYQRNDVSVTPSSLPTASFTFENAGPRGFAKQADLNSVNIENVTPSPSSPVYNSHSTFLSSISKGRGFSKFGQVENVTPTTILQQSLIPVQGYDGEANVGGSKSVQSVTPAIISEEVYRNGADRGFVKYNGGGIEVTPQSVLHGGVGLVQEGIERENLLGTFSYEGFGLKSQPGHNEDRTNYYYPKPTVQFNEGSRGELEPVKEEPFVAKKAYVTGNRYDTYRTGGFSSTPLYEEHYPIPASPEVPSTPIFVTSTLRPSYHTTIQSVYTTTAQPQTYYYHDSRLNSTPRPYRVKSTVIPTDVVISSTPNPILSGDYGIKSTEAPILSPVTQSKPIFKYEFSSFDSQYSPTPSPVDIEVTKRPVYNRVRVTTPITPAYEPVYIESTSVQPLLDDVNQYHPVSSVVENYQAPILKNRKVVKVIQPSSKAIVKVNDFHPLLSAKLGAQCTCIADSVRSRNKPVRVQIDDGDSIEEFVVKPEDSQEVVAITPIAEIAYGSTTPVIPISRGPIVVRKRLRVRPVSNVEDVFLQSTAIPNYQDDNEIIAVKQAQSLNAHNFDRYGPGGLRSRSETLQGTVDCQRAGLFRHPTQCNKFYSCRWDCTKNKFTLHVFNCPVHLTFDDSLGACNWPSQGPACLGNTLLPSD